ncbi:MULTISPECIES: hypothetical protein [unclassified Micromonospora]|uniref:hypothetical protein n=1 Tax=unclassified Micromonospora TaxID=2617518 RepID=UPI003A87DD65
MASLTGCTVGNSPSGNEISTPSPSLNNRSQETGAFESYLTQKIIEATRDFYPNADPETAKYDLIDTGDLNHDGMLDFIVRHDNLAYCGSAGCLVEVFVTRVPGSDYTVALSLTGGIRPQIRQQESSGLTEITVHQYTVGIYPVQSAYSWQSEGFSIEQYEFCGPALPSDCTPTIIEPVRTEEADKFSISSYVEHRAAPEDGAALIEPGEEARYAERVVIGTVGDGEWLLVHYWKGMAAFVPGQP